MTRLALLVLPVLLALAPSHGCSQSINAPSAPPDSSLHPSLHALLMGREGIKVASSLWIGASGDAAFVRCRDRDVLDHRTGKLSPARLQQLADALRKEGYWALEDHYTAAEDWEDIVVETDRVMLEVVADGNTKRVTADMQAAPASLARAVADLERLAAALPDSGVHGHLLRARPLTAKLIIGDREITEGERLRRKGVRFYLAQQVPAALRPLMTEVLDTGRQPFVPVSTELKDALLGFLLADHDGRRQQYIVSGDVDYAVELFTVKH